MMIGTSGDHGVGIPLTPNFAFRGLPLQGCGYRKRWVPRVHVRAFWIWWIRCCDDKLLQLAPDGFTDLSFGKAAAISYP